MKTPKLSYFVGAGALLGLIGLAAAATDPASPHLFRRALLEKVAELGMTDAQKTQIHAILRDSQPNLQPLIKQYVEERRALRRTIHTTPVDEAAIRAQATRIAQLESDLDVKRAYVAERICALLTPEQITRLKELARGVDATVDAAIERISNKIGGP